MKRTILIVLVIAALVLPVSVGAYKIGDIIGYSLTTDIAATINGYDIPSYNVGGFTYIIVEDLAYYGFSVSYDDSRRALNVSRDYAQSDVSMSYTKPYVSSNQVGTTAHALVYTDITTYFDGQYTESYNINGQTIVCFEALRDYGEVSYDDNKREISLKLSGLKSNPYPVDRRAAANNASVLGIYANPQSPDNFNVAIYEYDGHQISFEVTSVQGRGTRITGINITEAISNGVCYFEYEDSFGSVGNGVLTIVDNNTVTLSFDEITVGRGWSVVAAQGTHCRVSDIPADFVPWTNTLY